MNETEIEQIKQDKAQLISLVKAYTSVQENSEEWLQAAVPDWLKSTFYRWQHTNALLEQ